MDEETRTILFGAFSQGFVLGVKTSEDQAHEHLSASEINARVMNRFESFLQELSE